MNSMLPSENASANFCGRNARIGGDKKMNEKKKHTAAPAMHARKPRNLLRQTRTCQLVRSELSQGGCPALHEEASRVDDRHLPLPSA